jgi:hypothetical protein
MRLFAALVFQHLYRSAWIKLDVIVIAQSLRFTNDSLEVVSAHLLGSK